MGEQWKIFLNQEYFTQDVSKFIVAEYVSELDASEFSSCKDTIRVFELKIDRINIPDLKPTISPCDVSDAELYSERDRLADELAAIRLENPNSAQVDLIVQNAFVGFSEEVENIEIKSNQALADSATASAQATEALSIATAAQTSFNELNFPKVFYSTMGEIKSAIDSGITEIWISGAIPVSGYWDLKVEDVSIIRIDSDSYFDFQGLPSGSIGLTAEGGVGAQIEFDGNLVSLIDDELPWFKNYDKGILRSVFRELQPMAVTHDGSGNYTAQGSSLVSFTESQVLNGGTVTIPVSPTLNAVMRMVNNNTQLRLDSHSGFIDTVLVSSLSTTPSNMVYNDIVPPTGYRMSSFHGKWNNSTRTPSYWENTLDHISNVVEAMFFSLPRTGDVGDGYMNRQGTIEYPEGTYVLKRSHPYHKDMTLVGEQVRTTFLNQHPQFDGWDEEHLGKLPCPGIEYYYDPDTFVVQAGEANKREITGDDIRLAMVENVRAGNRFDHNLAAQTPRKRVRYTVVPYTLSSFGNPHAMYFGNNFFTTIKRLTIGAIPSSTQAGFGCLMWGASVGSRLNDVRCDSGADVGIVAQGITDSCSWENVTAFGTRVACYFNLAFNYSISNLKTSRARYMFAATRCNNITISNGQFEGSTTCRRALWLLDAEIAMPSISITGVYADGIVGSFFGNTVIWANYKTDSKHSFECADQARVGYATGALIYNALSQSMYLNQAAIQARFPAWNTNSITPSEFYYNGFRMTDQNGVSLSPHGSSSPHFTGRDATGTVVAKTNHIFS